MTAEAAPNVLDVRGLGRTYGPLRAVADVRFQVRAGQIFGFVGPNGAGKTTTLKLLATLDVPTSGDAFIGGHSIKNFPERARPLIGYMPDRSAVFPDTTVSEHIDFFARAFGLRGAERRQRVESVTGFTQLGSLAGKLMTELSKGMRQRVALARTLLHDPALLLLDEPADGLDPRARIELRELLKALAGQGKAILISSHILSELSEMCDSCAIIEQGRLLASGSVADILSGAAQHREAEYQEAQARGARSPEAQQDQAPVGDGEVLVARAVVPPPGPSLDLRIQMIAGIEDAVSRCERLLLEQPGVSDIRVSGAQLRVRVEGDERRANELLKLLVQSDVPVCSFHLHEANLEDAFMKVTLGRVQ